MTRKRRFGPILLGALIYVLLAAIPYLGQAMAVVGTLLGLGAVWLVWRDMRAAGATPGEAANLKNLYRRARIRLTMLDGNSRSTAGPEGRNAPNRRLRHAARPPDLDPDFIPGGEKL